MASSQQRLAILTTLSAVLTGILLTVSSALPKAAAVQQLAAFAGFVLVLATLGFAWAWVHARRKAGAKP